MSSANLGFFFFQISPSKMLSCLLKLHLGSRAKQTKSTLSNNASFLVNAFPEQALFFCRITYSDTEKAIEINRNDDDSENVA